jgi:tetratricopeptide (TPR) repeat protein
VGNAGEPLERAFAEHRGGQLAAAVEAYRFALHVNAGSVDAWANLGTALIALGHCAAASDAFARAMDLAPDNARLARDAAIGLSVAGESVLAERALQNALTADPTLIGARLLLSRICLERGARIEAESHAKRAIADSPSDASAHLELHLAQFDDRSIESAIPPILEAVRLDPGYTIARLLAGGALGLSSRHEEADAVLGVADMSLGLRASVDYAIAQRRDVTRYFATRRETLLHALAAATGTGPIVEFGVRFGVSTRILASATTEVVHAFDSFLGLPEAWNGRSESTFSTAGEIPSLPANVQVYAGWFKDTLPPVAATLSSPRFIHIDSDLYSSAKLILDVLGPTLRPGCVMVFDEYFGNERWREDEYRAFHEAAHQFQWRYEYIAMSWITGQAAIRLLEIG